MRANEVRVKAVIGARGFPRNSGGNATLMLVVTPATPNLSGTVFNGQLVATLSAFWTNRAPFTGSYRFVAPLFDHGGDYAITSGNQLVVNNAANLNALGTVTVEHVTIEAVQ